MEEESDNIPDTRDERIPILFDRRRSNSLVTKRRISTRLSRTNSISQRWLTFARRVHAERRIRSTLLMSTGL